MNTEKLQLEQKEINLLLSDNFKIEVPFFGRKFYFRSRKLTLKVMLQLANQFVKMNFKPEDLETSNSYEQLNVQYNAVKNNAKLLANVVAICVTDNCILKQIVKKQILKYYTPKDILHFAETLLKESDYKSFLLSIALMNGNRPTRASAIEK